MTELISPSLTGTKTDCLFGEVGHIFCVLIKVLCLTSPSGSSKWLVRVEIAWSLVAYQVFFMKILNYSFYIVCGVVLVRPSQNKLIWFSDAVLLFVVEWRQNIVISRLVYNPILQVLWVTMCIYCKTFTECISWNKRRIWSVLSLYDREITL